MKKAISTVFAAMGVVAVIAVAGLILRYATINMQRVNEEARVWRLTWANR